MREKKISDLRCWIMDLDYEYNLEIFVDEDEYGGKKFTKYAWPFDGREPEVMKELTREEMGKLIEDLMNICEIRKKVKSKIKQEFENLMDRNSS